MADKTYCKGGRDHLGPKAGAAETGKAVPRMTPMSPGKSAESGESGHRGQDRPTRANDRD